MTGEPVTVKALYSGEHDPLPFVGDTVHVRGAEGVCSPAIVMAVYHDGVLRLRVLYRAPVTEHTAARDTEGDYAPWWRAPHWVNPDGTSRIGDAWHYRYHTGNPD